MDDTLTLIIQARIREAQQQIDRLAAHMRVFQRTVDAMNRAATKGFQQTTRVVMELHQALQRLIPIAIRIGAVLSLGVAGGLAAIGRAGVNMNLTLQAAQMGLARITGSAGGATRLIGELRKEAATSALTFKEMLPIAQQLAAVYGPQGIGKVIPTMRAFADTAAALSVPTESLRLALLGFRQLLGREFAQQEELNQIGENLPGANIQNILRQAFGTADTEVLKEAGITGEQVGAAIIAGMQKSFGGAQAQAAGTIPIILSNFQDAWETLAANVTQRFTPMLASGLAKLLAMFQKLAENRKVIEALAVPFEALGRLLNWVGDNAERFHSWLEQIAGAEMVKQFLSAMIGLVQTLGERFAKVFGVDLNAFFDPARFGKLFGSFLGWIAKIIHAVFGMGRVFLEIQTMIQSAITRINDFVQDLWVDIQLGAVKAFFGIQEAAGQMVANVLNALARIADALIVTRMLPAGVSGQIRKAAGEGEFLAQMAGAGREAVELSQETGIRMHREGRERQRLREDPFRNQDPVTRIMQAFQGIGRDTRAEQAFFGEWAQNAGEAYNFLFGPTTAPQGAGGIPRSGVGVGSLGGNVNPAPPILRAMMQGQGGFRQMVAPPSVPAFGGGPVLGMSELPPAMEMPIEGPGGVSLLGGGFFPLGGGGGGRGGMSMLPQGGGGGLVYSPQYNIQGGLTREQVEQILALTRQDLERMIAPVFPGATGH